MKLEAYIKKNKLTHEQFADSAGITRQTVYNIITKKFIPSLKTIRLIEKATDNLVCIKDLA